MRIEEFILYYLKDNPSEIPSIRFWTYILFLINTGISITIQMEECDDPHELTVEDCFNEIEDLWKEASNNKNKLGGKK